MNKPFSQKGRLGKLHSNQGLDDLYLLRFTGSDALNDLFEYRAEVLSSERDLDMDRLLGTHVSVEIGSKTGPTWFDGIVTRAVWMGAGENGHRYDLEMRPWFWLAQRRRDQRIFHNMTAPEIVQDVLSAYASAGSPHLTNLLMGEYLSLEYTVQYRESDFAFCARLFERFGINYYFTHEQGNHTLILVDNLDEHHLLPGKTRPFLGVDGHHQADEEHFWEFRPERNITTGAIRLTDYNFNFPAAAMEVENQHPAPHLWGDLEAYDYPGDYLRQNVGATQVAPLRVEQERAQDAMISATGDVIPLKSGLRFGLTGDHIKSMIQHEHICVLASHAYVSDSYGTGGQSSDEYAYQGHYVMQPVTAPIVPIRKTPIPVVHGPQTAKVVGEGEIDCDDLGRILVQFHWDLNGAYSMRCRVSQNWAGRGWGGMVIPRIGMEVVVEFLEGDPDKPLVTGCVYNAANLPPYELPDGKTKSTFRSDTHEGTGYNELMFEDKANAEKIYMHAQKDHQIDVLNDRFKSVGHDESNTIANNREHSVGVDETLTIGNNRTESIGNEVSYTVGQNQVEAYGKDHVVSIGNIYSLSVGANRTVSIGGHDELVVAGDLDAEVAGTTNITSSEINLNAPKININAAGCKITLANGKITLEGTSAETKAITIDLKGITSMNMGGPGSSQATALSGAVAGALPLVENCTTKKLEEEDS